MTELPAGNSVRSGPFPISGRHCHRGAGFALSPFEKREAERFDVLSVLIENYEAQHHRIDAASPVEVVKFYMEQNSLSQTNLASVLGSRSRASEFLAERRDLSLSMIRAIAEAWHIPADLLLPPAGGPKENKRERPHRGTVRTNSNTPTQSSRTATPSKGAARAQPFKHTAAGKPGADKGLSAPKKPARQRNAG